MEIPNTFFLLSYQSQFQFRQTCAVDNINEDDTRIHSVYTISRVYLHYARVCGCASATRVFIMFTVIWLHSRRRCHRRRYKMGKERRYQQQQIVVMTFLHLYCRPMLAVCLAIYHYHIFMLYYTNPRYFSSSLSSIFYLHAYYLFPFLSCITQDN